MAKKPVTPLHERLGLKLGNRNDGWTNAMQGIGNALTDKREATYYARDLVLDRETLSSMYRTEGLAKKIVDIPAKDMTRAWFSIDGDTDSVIVNYLDSLKFKLAIKTALKWSRLYGGSLVLMGIDDGQTIRASQSGNVLLTRPLREESIRRIGFFRVYDRHQISWQSNDIDEDASSENYGRPKFYTITPINQSRMPKDFKVHYSRVLRFDGEALPESESAKMQGWGDSSLQAPYSRIRGFASSLISSEAIIDEFTVGVLTIKNLQDIIANGQEATLATRMKQIDMSKHILNTMIVDEDEDFRRISATVNGIKDILEFLKDVLSSVSGIPQVKLFGEQSQGLGGKAEGNIRVYYDDISDSQEEQLRPPLERVVKLVVGSQEFKARGASVSDKWHLKFNSLWQMSDKELAEARNLQSQADERYVKNGVLDPNEVAESRFGSDVYSFETRLDPANKGKREIPEKEAPDNGKEPDDKDDSAG